LFYQNRNKNEMKSSKKNYTMNKQEIVIHSGIGLAAVLRVGQLSWWVKLWFNPHLPLVLPTSVLIQNTFGTVNDDYYYCLRPFYTALAGNHIYCWCKVLQPACLCWQQL